MRTTELKVARIGNSRGVRLPADTLRRYRIGAVVLMEERVDGILLHPKSDLDDRLSWEDTAREMAAGGEDWSDWEGTTGDALGDIPWERSLPAVAEPRATYTATPPQGRRKRAAGGTA